MPNPPSYRLNRVQRTDPQRDIPAHRARGAREDRGEISDARRPGAANAVLAVRAEGFRGGRGGEAEAVRCAERSALTKGLFSTTQGYLNRLKATVGIEESRHLTVLEPLMEGLESCDHHPRGILVQIDDYLDSHRALQQEAAEKPH